MSGHFERRLLQAAIALLACVPIVGGLAGSTLWPRTLGGGALAIGSDSHLRYLSGLLLGIGVAFWSTIPSIELKADRFRLLAAIVMSGGVCRLAALFWIGVPGPLMVAALAMELVVTPLLALWCERVARVCTH